MFDQPDVALNPSVLLSPHIFLLLLKARVRRGAEVLESLQILPEDCEIEYVEHEQTEQTPDATETAELKDVVEEGTVEDEVDATMQQVHQNVDKPLEGAETPDDADATIAAPLTGKVAEKNNLARRASLFDLPDPSGDKWIRLWIWMILGMTEQITKAQKMQRGKKKDCSKLTQRQLPHLSNTGSKTSLV